MNAGNNRQHKKRSEQQYRVQPELRPKREAPHDEIGIRIAGEQSSLKEYEAGRPHGCRAAEPRENLLGDHRLYEKEQERARENGRCVEWHGKNRPERQKSKRA